MLRHIYQWYALISKGIQTTKQEKHTGRQTNNNNIRVISYNDLIFHFCYKRSFFLFLTVEPRTASTYRRRGASTCGIHIPFRRVYIHPWRKLVKPSVYFQPPVVSNEDHGDDGLDFLRCVRLTTALIICDRKKWWQFISLRYWGTSFSCTGKLQA